MSHQTLHAGIIIHNVYYTSFKGTTIPMDLLIASVYVDHHLNSITTYRMSLHTHKKLLRKNTFNFQTFSGELYIRLIAVVKGRVNEKRNSFSH